MRKCGRRRGLKRKSQAGSPAAAMAERPEGLTLPTPSSPESSRRRSGTVSASPRAASVFVLKATSCANSFATRGKLKTLNASDVLSAMEETEFQRFVTPSKEALEDYRREQKGKKEASEQKKDKDRQNKTDLEEQDKRRDGGNDKDEERLKEEEQNEERKWTTEEDGEAPLGRNHADPWYTFV